jgi:predicted O-methyltransferase YrrM
VIRSLQYWFKRSRLYLANWRALDQQRYWEQTMATPRYADPKRLLRYGAKAYSQNDEDGILAEIFRRIGANGKTFVEIGSGAGLENNTLALLVQGWRGLWVESDNAKAARARTNLAAYVASDQLRIENVFVTRENVDALLHKSAPSAEPDLLSIDVDGNDYHLWQAVQSISPRVVVMEYNASWFPPMSLAVAYQERFEWKANTYFGASLKALELLAERKGYRLVGCCFAGVNAFFVRADLCGTHFSEPYTAENHYEPARYWMLRTAGHPPGIGPVEIVE